jgi:hypothetical protein
MSMMRGLNVFRSLFFFIMMALAFGAHAAEEEPCGVLEVYDHVLSLAISDTEARNASEVVILRYIPGDTTVEREYRIALTKDGNGKLRATRVDANALSIQSQLRAADPLPCSKATAYIKLRSRTFDNQAVLKKIFASLHAIRLPVRLASELYLDAPRYEILMQAGMNEVSFVLYGPTAQASIPHPLISWFLRTANALPAAVP